MPVTQEIMKNKVNGETEGDQVKVEKTETSSIGDVTNSVKKLNITPDEADTPLNGTQYNGDKVYKSKEEAEAAIRRFAAYDSSFGIKNHMYEIDWKDSETGRYYTIKKYILSDARSRSCSPPTDFETDNEAENVGRVYNKSTIYHSLENAEEAVRAFKTYDSSIGVRDHEYVINKYYTIHRHVPSDGRPRSSSSEDDYEEIPEPAPCPPDYDTGDEYSGDEDVDVDGAGINVGQINLKLDNPYQKC